MRIPAIPRVIRSRRRSARRGNARGQSLVEFAMALPVLLFLTLIALDFGRVYLGYINLQNMARIAANYAANNPDAWGSSPDAAVKARYENQILGDAAATNCSLPQKGGQPVIPNPQFIDGDSDGDSTKLGDSVRVQLSCDFGVITPGVASVLGGTVKVSAESNFPVKAGLSAVATGGAEPPVGGGVGPVAAFSANLVITPSTISGTTPFVVEFRDTSGGSPTAWSWDFDDGTVSKAQDPLDHTFTTTDPSHVFHVTLLASNQFGSGVATMDVVVVGQSDVDFTSSGTVIESGTPITFTDTSTPGGTAYAWTFGDGGTATGPTAQHTYTNTAGSPFTVSLTVTYPAPIGAVTTTKPAYITVNPGKCTVPSLDGVKFNNAQAAWAAKNFTGVVARAPGAPNGNFTIHVQSQTASFKIPCDSDVEVKDK
jgi:PKD repeat protein